MSKIDEKMTKIFQYYEKHQQSYFSTSIFQVAVRVGCFRGGDAKKEDESPQGSDQPKRKRKSIGGALNDINLQKAFRSRSPKSGTKKFVNEARKSIEKLA